MKVLLIGSGGREHALAWKITQSPTLETLYCAPGNPGMERLGERVAIADSDVPALVGFATERGVDLVVVGPEAPLAKGIADACAAAGVACFGPSAEAAQLETSKAFTKALCAEYGIPTAAYGQFSEPAPAKAFLREQHAPYVIKADGLAAGKGVVIAATLGDADAAVDDMLAGQFGAAGGRIVIEEFLEGEEASFFALCDGETVLPMIAAQDHKRAHDGDTGPNTGGMGAYSPAPVFTDAVRAATLSRIVEPTVRAMAARGTPYRGVLYAGLMIGAHGPKLIEYNSRFGDPECQVLMRRLQSDLLPVLAACANGKLKDAHLEWSDEAAALVVLATNGYPGAYEKGSVIRGLDTAGRMPGVEIFQAGTDEQGGRIVSAGGRVLGVSATGADVGEAVARTYAGVDAVDWPEGFCRRDIGWRAVRGAS